MISSATEKLIELALQEDLGAGDVTSRALLPANSTNRAELVARQRLVLSGLQVVEAIFRRLDAKLCFVPLCGEGELVKRGQAVARLSGNSRAMLAAERTALNFLRHLCGVATLTRQFTDRLRGTSCRLLDTRKTTPGMRELEKAAVRAGGGHNHRMGLFDGVLVKDNHLAAVGSVRRAVELARRSASPTLKIEVECTTLKQVRQALDAGADIIMLDNMPLEQMRRAVELAADRTPLEASGNVSLENVRQVAECGVDFVSVGAITHSAPAADLSLEFLPR